MESIRIGVFETNSSSTHSLTMCSSEDYSRWENGEVYLNDYRKDLPKFCTKEEAMKYLAEKGYKFNSDDNDSEDEFLRKNDIYTIDNFFRDDMKSFYDEFTTKTGEKIIAFGYYGHD
jgi:hypothetical protein